MKKDILRKESEKGAISTLVLFTILMMLAILMTVYAGVTSKAKSQLKSDIRIQEVYGEDVTKVNEVYDEVIEAINQNNVKKVMTFDYNIDDKYKNTKYMDTNYKIDWSQDFSLETTIKIEELNQRYLIIGSYDNSSQKELNIEITAANKLRVYFGKNSDEFVQGTVFKDEDIKVIFTWDKTQKSFNISAKGTRTNIEYSNNFEIDGNASKNLRIGCKDNSSANTFGTIYVKDLKIKEYKAAKSSITKVTETAVTRPNYTFNGWYTQKNGGNKITQSIKLQDDKTVYANWTRNGDVEIDGDFYTTITTALTHVPDDASDYTTIRLFGNISENFSISSKKKVILDCQEYTLSKASDTKLIENKGYLMIVGGTITSDAGSAIINNESTGHLIVSGGRLIATGKRQAIYNNGGTLTISDNAYLSAVTTERGTVQNLNNGTLVITGGTIISTNQQGVKNESGTLTIGIKNGSIDSTKPKIKGKTYGVTSYTTNYFLYDGIILGADNTVAVDKEPLTANIEDNASIVKGTVQEDGKTYKTLYLAPTN